MTVPADMHIQIPRRKARVVTGWPSVKKASKGAGAERFGRYEGIRGHEDTDDDVNT